MEIRHLRYFVAVASTLHFGRAARLLHMSQPPLSKRIADLESEIGAALFDRSRRQVTLTPAGRSLLPKARAALDAFERAATQARALSAATAPRLRLALPPDSSREVLLDVVRRLHRVGVAADVSEATTAEQHAMLVAGDLDVGVLRHPYDGAGLRSSPPLRQTLGVVVDAQHPLASRESIRLDELQGSPLVLFPRSMAPGLYDEILLVCRHEGYVPPRVVHGIRMTAALLGVARAVAFTTPTLIANPLFSGFRELCWKPIAGEPLHWWTSAVCRGKDRDPRTREAVSAMLTALQEHDHWAPAPRPRRRAAATAGRPAGSRRVTPAPASESLRAI